MKRVLWGPLLVLIVVISLMTVFAWAESRMGYETFGWAAVTMASFLAVTVLLSMIVVIRRDNKKNRDN